MLYGFIYDNAKYFYIRDTLQNILGIVDANGTAVVHYNYSAYGECKAITGLKKDTIGVINSFRYKGYYFDNETEFFYCRSRYYLPRWGRWLNCDSPYFLIKNAKTLNLFAYCQNDPCNNIDSNGQFALSASIIATIVKVAIVVAVVIVIAATINDIYQIASGNVYVDENKTNSENVHIENSYKILTPWMRYGYSFFLNHINPNTKDVIQGSTFGVQFEWALHNYACWLGLGGDSAKHLDVGKSIFADGQFHPLRDESGNVTTSGIMSLGMRIGYILLANPIYWIWDLIANGGF